MCVIKAAMTTFAFRPRTRTSKSALAWSAPMNACKEPMAGSLAVADPSLATDHRHQPSHPAIQLLFLPVREKEVIAIHRAERGEVNPIGRQAGSQQLISIRLMQVNSGMSLAGGREQFA